MAVLHPQSHVITPAALHDTEAAQYLGISRAYLGAPLEN